MGGITVLLEYSLGKAVKQESPGDRQGTTANMAQLHSARPVLSAATAGGKLGQG